MYRASQHLPIGHAALRENVDGKRYQFSVEGFSVVVPPGLKGPGLACQRPAFSSRRSNQPRPPAFRAIGARRSRFPLRHGLTAGGREFAHPHA